MTAENETTNSNEVSLDYQQKSLIIPINSETTSDYVEILSDELSSIPAFKLIQVLKDENANLDVWADVALMYTHLKHDGEASSILQEACDRPDGGNKEQRIRVLASAGIAHLTQASSAVNSSSSALNKKRIDAESGAGGGSVVDPSEELRSLADTRFTQSSRIDTLFPMQWIGRGMLNLSVGRMDQARFFFETTLKQCGQVLPALLGMAAILYREEDYRGAQSNFGKAITLYPSKAGAAARVGYGLSCYRLGQIDRARASFQRAIDMDPENVDAIIGSAVLEMCGGEELLAKDFRKITEKSMKMISMANLLDHSNAMVQNHLANHYFWKWTPIPGTVSVTQGSNILKGSQPIPLDVGERIRIGTDVKTYVESIPEGNDDNVVGTTFVMNDVWRGQTQSGLRCWKKDYDRVIALAKGAYNSTTVPEIQAESLFHLARVNHQREDYENANKFYERSCKLAPNFSPARFGLAQTLISMEEYDFAAAHLRLVISSCTTATDALALFGLLECRSNAYSAKKDSSGESSAGKNKRTSDGLTSLKKAVDLDPLNPELVLLEALSLQQSESDYQKSFERYKVVIELLESLNSENTALKDLTSNREDAKKNVPCDILANAGVLCHETKSFDEALSYYNHALEALNHDQTNENSSKTGGKSFLLYNYIDTNLTVIETRKAELSQNSTNMDCTSLTLEWLSPHTEGDSTRTKLQVGDRIKIGENFESLIHAVEQNSNGCNIQLNCSFVSWCSEIGLAKDVTSDKIDVKDKMLKVSVQRVNENLSNPTAVSIAFNIACLHEAAGRTLTAVELHKAILKCNPAYVNSCLRLACISRDCSSLIECGEWLKISAASAPGNSEVLTLVGNLHLSLCDWGPAQKVFDQLLAQKVPNSEAYSMLSLGNVYFSNLKNPGKYSKHLSYAGDFYRRILSKDDSNAYAANGLGTVLAEKGELSKAKEVFNRVREVSSDTIADAQLNLGHIYLAQKKHPEALQIYRSYMKKIEDGTAPTTSKSRDMDVVEVLCYIAFSYFDWARQTELFNDPRAAPADLRYQRCVEHLELALSKSKRENVLIKYNWCLTKLQAANCVLQKLTRNIPRTAKEVGDALKGLEDSLPAVQQILGWKTEGKKIPIGTSLLHDFITNCEANIESAKSHLQEEYKRENDVNELRELQRLEAETKSKELEFQQLMQKEEQAKKTEELDQKAKQRMQQVQNLREGWAEEEALKASAKRETKQSAANAKPPADFDDDVFEKNTTTADTAALFDDSDDESDKEDNANSQEGKANLDEQPKSTGLNDGSTQEGQEAVRATEEDLFGNSDDEGDEQVEPNTSKRQSDDTTSDNETQPVKKRRMLEEDE